MLSRKLQAKGMNVTTPDRNSFVEKMQPAYEKVSELSGKEAMELFLTSVKQAKIIFASPRPR